MQLLWHAGPARQRAQTVLGPRSLTQFVPARLGANRALRPAPRDELLLSAAAQPLALRRVDGTIEVAIDPLSLPELPLALEALLKSRSRCGPVRHRLRLNSARKRAGRAGRHAPWCCPV